MVQNYEDLLSEETKSHKIMTLDHQKRERILGAAMHEFLKGYRQANTDVMVQNAEISKGLLFHYFGTKKKLFLFLIRYVLDIIGGEFEKERFENKDYIENLWQLSHTSIRLLGTYPTFYQFLVAGIFSMKDEFPEEIGSFHNPVEAIKERCFEQADRSLIRDDVDPEKALNIILWATNGYADTLTRYGTKMEAYTPHYGQIMEEFRQYLDLLRQTFYKQGREEDLNG